MANIRSQSKRSKWVMYPTVALVLPNFIAFIIGNLYLGGDALNGYQQAAHYFVCAHGSCTEVTQRVWNYSYWHALSAMGGILLVLIEAAIFITTGDIILDFNRRA
jgi:hypothetical protein